MRANLLRFALPLCALWLANCAPRLDDPNAQLQVPASLPPFSQEPPAPAVTQRSQELLAEGQALADKGRWLQAVQKQTEALATDPANPQARLALARTFARGGRSSVALALLQPAAQHLKDCGACVDLLQAARNAPELQHLRQTSQGEHLFAPVPTAPLPYLRWAADVDAALQSGNVDGLAPYIHARLPFALVRSCPACDLPAATAPSRRDLVGIALAAKVAARFDRVHPEAFGIALGVLRPPQCAQGCCTYGVPAPVPRGEAALRRLCFAPTTPTHAALTEIELVYGAPN